MKKVNPSEAALLLNFTKDAKAILKNHKANKPLNKAEKSLVELLVTRKPAKAELGRAKNIAAAAAMTGINSDLIQLARDKGAQCFGANGTIDVDALLIYIAAHPELIAEIQAAPDVKGEKVLEVTARRKLLEQKFQERERMLIPVDEIKRTCARNVIACKTKMYAGENSIPVEAGLLLGLNQEQVLKLKGIVTKANRTAIKEMHQGEFGKCICPHCEKEIV